MIRLIIKGTVQEASEAATAHGLTLVKSRTLGRNERETVADVADDTRATVAAWFNEPPYAAQVGVGFPAGSLLWYQEGAAPMAD
jgi:hypothetical protein